MPCRQARPKKTVNVRHGSAFIDEHENMENVSKVLFPVPRARNEAVPPTTPLGT